MSILQMPSLQLPIRVATASAVLNMQKANILIHPAMTSAQIKHMLNGRRLVARPEPREVA